MNIFERIADILVTSKGEDELYKRLYEETLIDSELPNISVLKIALALQQAFISKIKQQMEKQDANVFYLPQRGKDFH